MKKTVFEFPAYSKRIDGIKKSLEEELSKSADAHVRKLLEEMPSTGSSSPLTIAFIGQYNAGKSTIIKALTDRKDIKIDDDVCTDKVTAYDWEGIKILDTPGIYAGYPDHDEKTYSVMDKADLLVFVISSSLFDNIIGEHFREICFTRDKAAETMLVVNRMTDYPGSPQVKLPIIQDVLSPKKPEDFYVTFIDALSYIDAADEESEDGRRELLTISNFESFVKALNCFVRAKDLMGRLTTPLFQIRSLAQQAAAFLDVDTPEEKVAIQLLTRKQSVILSSRARLTGSINALIRKTSSRVIALGDELAEMIEPGLKDEDINEKDHSTQQEAEELFASLQREIDSEVKAEISQLQQEVEIIEEGSLNQLLRNQFSKLRADEQHEDTGGGSSKIQPESMDFKLNNWPERFASVMRVSNNIGKLVSVNIAVLTSGPLSQTAKIGSIAASRGSQAHKAVLTVGKFFNVKFKPWGAVKIAAKLGKAGRVIGTAAPVLAAAGQIAEDVQKKKNESECRKMRKIVRQEYRQRVHDAETSLSDMFEKLILSSYEKELTTVDEYLTHFTSKISNRNESAKKFSNIASLATEEIEKIQLNKN